MKFIIEHLENEMYKWCLIEYKNISKYVGKNNLIITNVEEKEVKKLKNICQVNTKSVLELNLKNACLLDAKSNKELNPKDAKNFDYFIFGGILGDFPEQGRTEKYLTSKLKNVEVRNLLDKQMPTDTAVLVTKLVTEGNNLKDLKFKDNIKIEIKKGKLSEEIELPFRYLILNNKPVISKELIKYLKEKEDI